MRNIKLIIQYDGTRYNGWQNQKNTTNTIQTKLETVLSRMTGEAIDLAASGRTDAGVHASAQVANFKSNTTRSCDEIVSYINEYLPADIAVLSAEDVGERFHSRLNATGKTYIYRIWNSAIPNVFARAYVHSVPQPLDIARMKEAVELLCGKHDFQAFCATKPGKKSTIRTLSNIEIIQTGHEITLRFTGDGFLYHMVRILVGTLIEIGLGTRELSSISPLFEEKKRANAGYLAPACGLCLQEVYYNA